MKFPRSCSPRVAFAPPTQKKTQNKMNDSSNSKVVTQAEENLNAIDTALNDIASEKKEAKRNMSRTERKAYLKELDQQIHELLKSREETVEYLIQAGADDVEVEGKKEDTKDKKGTKKGEEETPEAYVAEQGDVDEGYVYGLWIPPTKKHQKHTRYWAIYAPLCWADMPKEKCCCLVRGRLFLDEHGWPVSVGSMDVAANLITPTAALNKATALQGPVPKGKGTVTNAQRSAFQELRDRSGDDYIAELLTIFADEMEAKDS